MEALLTYTTLIIVTYGVVHYSVVQMKKLGVIFVLIILVKYIFGVSVTFFAFYVISLSGNFCKDMGLTTLFSLPIGIVVWFVPMHYASKLFLYLEDKYKKQGLK